MIASVLTAASTRATETMTNGVFMVTSLMRVLLPKFRTFKMNTG